MAARYPGAVIVLGLGLWAVGALALLDERFPLNLTRYEDRSVLVRDEQGGILRAFLTADEKWRLPLRPEDVDAAYVNALVAYEDKRFWRHAGVDPLAIVRAAWQWAVHGHIVSGASTLTMQAARLLEPRPRTLGAKLIEAVRAVQLEWHLSKPDILSVYLTLAPYGGNLEGARAASLAYFGKEPTSLTAAEAALLIALPQSPEARRPDRHADSAKATRDGVIDRLVATGALTAEAAAEARSDALPAARAEMPFYAPQLAQRLVAQARSGVVDTTIDGKVQRRLEELVASETRWFDDGAGLAIVVVDNETRAVKAYLGGADFWGPAGQIDLARASRSPGSALKPFIYGLAFDDLAVHPDTLIDDRPMVFGDYAPENFSLTFQGTVTVREALRQSLNVPAVALLDAIGPVRLAAALSDAGAALRYAQRGTMPSLPLALGGVGISLVDLTTLYVGLANGGDVRALRFTTSAPEALSHRIMSRASAWYVTTILRGSPMPDGWAQRFGIDRARNIAFKTGTSYGFRDAWAVGFTGTYTVGVWVGRPDGSARPGYFGRNTAAPLLLKIFDNLPSERRGFLPKPDMAMTVARNEDLPLNMRVFTPRVMESRLRAKATVGPPPVIKFPANGVTVALPEDERPIVLKAVGGTGALRWIVNGELLPHTDDLAAVFWSPRGSGYADIVVVDAAGRRARSQVRLIGPAQRN